VSIDATYNDFAVAVVGGGVVGGAVALALARRGVAVVVFEAEAAPGLAASGTNSGILHTGFDSVPGELETELILRAAALRDPVIDALGVPIVRCGALMRGEVASLADNARRNGVEVHQQYEDALEVPGEAVTDPVAYTTALVDAAARHGAHVHTACRVVGVDAGPVVATDDGERFRCRVLVNCAGLYADDIASLCGDDSF
jgi:glycerol-3-phosphate dehydrogenase